MFKILFENHELVVIHKPAGVVVNKATSVKGVTVQEWMEMKIENYKQRLTECEKVNVDELKLAGRWDELNRVLFYKRAGVVHRLDKETSGVLVLAKNEEMYLKLLEQFRERTVWKRYVALVHGKMVEDQGYVEAPLGRLPWNRLRFGVLEGGREAYTEWHVLERFEGYDDLMVRSEEWVKWFDVEVFAESGRRHPGNKKFRKDGYSLVECFPKTGRTHQIRVHMLHLGHPFVGDDIYAGRKLAKWDRAWCGHLLLSAVELGIDGVGKWSTLDMFS